MGRKIVVFTDLDGTLLDHESYAWEPARPALEMLRQRRVPVILCSSKTRSEIATLRDELDNRDPFIVENGAAVVIPQGYFEAVSDSGSYQPPDAEPDRTVSFGTSRDRILEVLTYLKQQGFRFRSFAGMSTEQLAALTGLSEDAAARARTRTATEPLLWDGDAASLELFRSVLSRYQLQLLAGGRFFHVMGHFDKADAMEYLLERFRVFYRKQDVLSVALGDSANDIRMLEQADIAVAIRGADGNKLHVPGRKDTVHSEEKGPEGWNSCMLRILKETSLQSAESRE